MQTKQAQLSKKKENRTGVRIASTTKTNGNFTVCLKKYGLFLDSCVGIFTDGAPSMAVCKKDFAYLAEKHNLYIVRIQCFLQ